MCRLAEGDPAAASLIVLSVFAMDGGTVNPGGVFTLVSETVRNMFI
jgi:hypothetical protein